MRNTPFLFIILFACTCKTFAQPEISLSEPFDEPAGNSWKRVLQLKNGNTFFFYNAGKTIEVTVYDKQHKVKSQQAVNGKEWQAKQIKGSTITTVQEINGEPVVFLTTTEDKTQKLFRVIFDAEEGKIKDEKKIDLIPKYELGDEGVVNGFYVEKDPVSDNYAIVTYNNKMGDATKRIKVTLYSNTHQELASASYGKPDNFRFLNYIGMCVIDKEVVLATCLSNTDAIEDKTAKLILSRLHEGEASLTHQVAVTEDNFKLATGVLRYHAGKKRILMLTHALAAVKGKTGTIFSKVRTINNNYITLLSEIDPEKLTITSSDVPYNTLSQQQKRSYPGYAQDLIINKDKTLTIVSEDLVKEEVNTSYQSATGLYKSYRTGTVKLEDIGVTNIDEKGIETKAVNIPKSQLYGIYQGAFIHAVKRTGYWENLILNFFSFDYINTGTNQYVIFNDIPENFAGKNKTYTFLGGQTLMCYEISDKPSKYFLFGAPDGQKNRAFSDLRASDFQSSTNTYATLIVETERKKQGRIAWMTFK